MRWAKYIATKGVSVSFQSFFLLLITCFFLLRLLELANPAFDILNVNTKLSLIACILAYMWLRERKVRTNMDFLVSDLRGLNTELEEAQVAATAALVKSVEAKDPYTHGHSERVRRLAVALASRMALPEDTIELVGRSAILHDVGKMGIADELLHKRGPLSSEEWNTLRCHPHKTREILSPLKFLSREAAIAAMHHERFDGLGYPEGVKGDQIPIEASIIAVADSFDAMNSDRPYRPLKLSADAIKQQLKASRDTQHPAAVVDAFLLLLDEMPEFWNGHEERFEMKKDDRRRGVSIAKPQAASSFNASMTSGSNPEPERLFIN